MSKDRRRRTFQLKQREQIFPSSACLLYEDPPQIGWCPPTLGVSFTPSTDWTALGASVRVFWKGSQRHPKVKFYQLRGPPLTQSSHSREKPASHWTSRKSTNQSFLEPSVTSAIYVACKTRIKKEGPSFRVSCMRPSRKSLAAILYLESVPWGLQRQGGRWGSCGIDYGAKGIPVGKGVLQTPVIA